MQGSPHQHRRFLCPTVLCAACRNPALVRFVRMICLFTAEIRRFVTEIGSIEIQHFAALQDCFTARTQNVAIHP